MLWILSSNADVENVFNAILAYILHLYGTFLEMYSEASTATSTAAQLVFVTHRVTQVAPLFRKLPVCFWVQFKMLVMIFKTLHKIDPDYLMNHLVLLRQTRWSRNSNWWEPGEWDLCCSLLEHSALWDEVCPHPPIFPQGPEDLTPPLPCTSCSPPPIFLISYYYTSIIYCFIPLLLLFTFFIPPHFIVVNYPE